jgi:hypothetical protein
MASHSSRGMLSVILCCACASCILEIYHNYYSISGHRTSGSSPQKPASLPGLKPCGSRRAISVSALLVLLPTASLLYGLRGPDAQQGATSAEAPSLQTAPRRSAYDELAGLSGALPVAVPPHAVGAGVRGERSR